MSYKSSRGAEEEGEERRGGGMGEGVMYMRVMTDEQMEVLRRQIAVYATICEQLVEMHKAFTAHHDSIAGLRLGSLYCDSLMTPKISARQRWTPTPVQLQILESIFDQGNGAPSKAKIKEIAQELLQHGQISESNVYNWFQNRRARSKRKQAATLPNNSESEVEADEESPNEKKAKPERVLHEKLSARVDDLYFPHTETTHEVPSIDQETKRSQGMYMLNGVPNSSSNLSKFSFYENTLSNPRTNHLIGKMEIHGNYSTSRPGESDDIMG